MSPELNLHSSSYTATMKIEYGGDLWWKGYDLMSQVLGVANPIFEWAFSGCQAAFLFDDMTSHFAFATDVL